MKLNLSNHRHVLRRAIGELSVSEFARRIPVSRQAVHNWLQVSRIPPGRIKRVVALSDGRVTIDDFEGAR